jgi:hypothetical protein
MDYGKPQDVFLNGLSLDKMKSVADGLKRMNDMCSRLEQRADKISKRFDAFEGCKKTDEAGDVVQGDPAAAAPLAARS